MSIRKCLTRNVLCLMVFSFAVIWGFARVRSAFLWCSSGGIHCWSSDSRKWRPQSCCQMPFRAKPVWLSGFWFRKCCCSGWSDSLFESLILCFEDVDISSAASMNWRKISQKGNLDQQHFCVSTPPHPPPPPRWINLNRMILRCNFLLSKSLLKKIRKY